MKDDVTIDVQNVSVSKCLSWCINWRTFLVIYDCDCINLKELEQHQENCWMIQSSKTKMLYNWTRCFTIKWEDLRHVTRQFFWLFQSDQFISKFSVTVAVYNKFEECNASKTACNKKHHHIQIETRLLVTRDFFCGVGVCSRNVQHFRFL